MKFEVSLILQAIAAAVALALVFRLYLRFRGYRLHSRDRITDRLDLLDHLHRSGRITAEEHARQRAAILSQV